MKYNIIFVVILVLCVVNSSCTNTSYAIKNKEYKELIDSLRYAYTLSICYKSHQVKGVCTICDYVNLERWNKSIEDYRNDSTALIIAIENFYNSDSSLIKYLNSFKKVKRDFPNFEYFSNRNLLFESNAWNILKITRYYKFMNNACLDLILNYYLNTDHKRIKLLLNVDYIRENKISTSDLYERLDKIFEKYGYEDKEKIRKAIMEDFGSLIALEGM